jgi:hypothetical protein
MSSNKHGLSHDGCEFTSRVRSSTASTRTIHSGGGCHKDNAFSIPSVCELLEGVTLEAVDDPALARMARDVDATISFLPAFAAQG